VVPFGPFGLVYFLVAADLDWRLLFDELRVAVLGSAADSADLALADVTKNPGGVLLGGPDPDRWPPLGYG